MSVTWLVCEMSIIVWQFEHALALPFLGMGMKTGLPLDASDRGRLWWRLSPTSVRAVSHCAQSLSRARLLVTPWTAAHQTPLSKEVSRQEYWSGLPCPPPGGLPKPGIKPRSPALQVDSLPSEPPGLGQLDSNHSGKELGIGDRDFPGLSWWLRW